MVRRGAALTGYRTRPRGSGQGREGQGGGVHGGAWARSERRLGLAARRTRWWLWCVVAMGEPRAAAGNGQHWAAALLEIW